MLQNSAWYRPSVADLNKPEPFTAKDQGDATKAYLQWLAASRGFAIPSGVSYEPRGIVAGVGKDAKVILAMPGYMARADIIDIEEMDDAGNVARSIRMNAKPNGALQWNAAKVRQACGPVETAPKAKRKACHKAAKCSPPDTAATNSGPAVAPLTAPRSEESAPMNSEALARIGALETMVRDLCAVLAANPARVASIQPEAAQCGADVVKALSGPEIAPASFLDLVGEAPAVAAADVVEAIAADAPADSEAIAAMQARIDRLEDALSRAHAGRRRAVRALHRERRDKVLALAGAREADQEAMAQRDRADAAERTVSQMRPLLDMLDQMRPYGGAAVDDGFCKPARGDARWPIKAQA